MVRSHCLDVISADTRAIRNAVSPPAGASVDKLASQVSSLASTLEALLRTGETDEPGCMDNIHERARAWQTGTATP